MIRIAALSLCVAGIGGCDMPVPGKPASGASEEYIVLGGGMSYQACRAKGGLLIHDRNSHMFACDPRVIRRAAPAGGTNAAVHEGGAL